MLSSQIREFHKFFCAINCCSCNTFGVRRIFRKSIFLRKLFLHRIVFAFFHLVHIREKNAKFLKKNCEFFSRIFAFFAKFSLAEPITCFISVNSEIRDKGLQNMRYFHHRIPFCIQLEYTTNKQGYLIKDPLDAKYKTLKTRLYINEFYVLC